MNIHDPELAHEVSEQTTPAGGSRPDGTMPGAGLVTVPAGIATVREVPSLESVPFAQPLALGVPSRFAGRVPLRRRLHITCDVAVWFSNTEAQAANHQGFRLPANQLWSPTIACEMFACAEAAGTITVWAEMDAS